MRSNGEKEMKTFRQHIKEGGQMGVGTTSHHDSVENGSVGVHNIHEPAIMQRVNAFVGAVADREYIKPEGALADLEEKLGQKEFIRVHQSYMVNIKKIESLNPVRNIIVVKGEELPIGRSYKKNLLNRIHSF